MIANKDHHILDLALAGLILLSGMSCASPPADEARNTNQPAPPAVQPTQPVVPNTELGSIKVGSRPIGATVLLISEEGGGAGRPQPRGTTPATISNLAPGKYAVHLELRGYRPYQKSIEVKAGETVTVTTDLKRQ